MLGLSGCGASGRDVDEALLEVKALTEKFHRTMIQCPNRIWSDYSWDGFKIVLLYPERDMAWVWDATANSLSEIDVESLPPEASLSSYAFFELDDHPGQPLMSLNKRLLETHDQMFRFGVHEFFHRQGQTDWIRKSEGRGTPYPVSAEPRLHRRMLFDSLIQHLETGEPQYLNAARYWFDRWSEDTLDSMQNTDQIEGTAYYLEFISVLLAENGCEISERELSKLVIEVASTTLGASVGGEQFDVAREGYEIGGLSALILRFGDTDLRAWNKAIATGATPVSVLLADIMPIKGIEPSVQLIEQFEGTARQMNDEIGTFVDSSIAQWNDTRFVRVAAPPGDLQSQFSPLGFIYARALDIELVPLARNHLFTASDGVSKYTFLERTVVTAQPTPLCAFGGGFITLVPEEAIRYSPGLAELDTPTVKGTFPAQLRVAEDGFLYLCVQ